MNTQFNKTPEIKLHATDKHTMSIIHLAYEYENTTLLILISINIERRWHY